MTKVICNKADSLGCRACPHGKPHEREERGKHYCTEWAKCYWKPPFSIRVSVRCVKVNDNPQGGEEGDDE